MAKRKEMSHESATRRGMTNAKFNEEQSDFLFGEIFFIALFSGLYCQSWIVFGLVFLGLIIMLFVKPLANALILAFSVAWGVLGYALGSLFDSTGASITLAVLAFLCSWGCNLAAIQWVRDIGEGDER